MSAIAGPIQRQHVVKEEKFPSLGGLPVTIVRPDIVMSMPMTSLSFGNVEDSESARVQKVVFCVRSKL